MSKKHLYFFVGLPGSGKSTWRNSGMITSFRGEDEITFKTVLSTDDYIEEKARRENMSYNEAWKIHAKDADKWLKSVLNSSLGLLCDVIWDQTNIYKKSRIKKIKRFGNDYKKYCIVFNRTLDELIEVNDKRKSYGRNLPNAVLELMYKTYEEPTLDEGFDEIIYVNKT